MSCSLKKKFILQNIRLIGQNLTLQLPIEYNNGTVFIYQEENIITIEQKDHQFKLECNLKYKLCIFELAGWYYGKTAGLFGTMNNEQVDDMLTSYSSIETNIEKFALSWSVNKDKICKNLTNLAITSNLIFSSTNEMCNELFKNKTSEFSSCFNLVDPASYWKMCSNTNSTQETCSIAMSYLQICMFYDTYLRIPSKCSACKISEKHALNIAEGDFYKLEGKLEYSLILT